MALQHRLYRLAASGEEIAGYGLHGNEILVANDNDPKANAAFVSKIKEHFTRAVVIADNKDLAEALRDLRACEARLGDTYDHISKTEHRDYNHFLKSFGPQISACLAFAMAKGRRCSFDGLRQDISETIDSLGTLFNKNAEFSIMLRYFGPKRHEGAWHADSQMKPDDIAAVRALSPMGTVIAFDETKDSHALYKLLGDYPEKAGHAGQSTAIIKHDTIHKTPAWGSGRWIYRINQPATPLPS